MGESGELNNHREAIKLKHEKFLRYTIIWVAIVIGILTAIITTDKLNVSFLNNMDRDYAFAFVLISGAAVLTLLHRETNKLEKLFGYKSDLEEGKMNKLAQIIDDKLNFLAKKLKRQDEEQVIYLILSSLIALFTIIGILFSNNMEIVTAAITMLFILVVVVTIADVIEKFYKKKVSCEIRCLNCNEWFKSGIQFGSFKTKKSSILEGNLQQCPHCKKMTKCNKENMRFKERENGRTIIEEGEDAYTKKKE